MKKISQGQFQVFATKNEAIRRFQQLQGICREDLSNGKRIQFFCSRKGKITITNPYRRRLKNENATHLFAEIVEQEGKTYVTYFTAFSSAFKLVGIWIEIMAFIACLVSCVMNAEKAVYFIIPLFGLILFGHYLVAVSKEKENSPKDSHIMVQELQNRVEAVNRWDQ